MYLLPPFKGIDRRLQCLDLAFFNRLTQVRDTFPKAGIEELAADIKAHHLIQFPTVCLYTSRKKVQAHLAIINKLWRLTGEDAHTVDNLVKTEEGWYILVAGERRYRAMHDVLGWKEIEVVAWVNPKPEFAISLQLTENVGRVQPDPKRQAYAYDRLFSMEIARDPSFTIHAFAKQTGRSYSLLSSALKYSQLPESLRLLAEGENGLGYGQAVALAELQDVCSADLLLSYGVYFMIKKFKVSDAKKFVKIKKSEASNQASFNFMEEITSSSLRTRNRAAGAAALVQVALSQQALARTVSDLYSRGLMGNSSAPLSEGASIRAIHEALVLARDVYAHHGDQVLSKKTHAEGLEILNGIK